MNAEEKKELMKDALHKAIDNSIPWKNLDGSEITFMHKNYTNYKRDYMGEMTKVGKNHGKITIEW